MIIIKDAGALQLLLKQILLKIGYQNDYSQSLLDAAFSTQEDEKLCCGGLGPFGKCGRGMKVPCPGGHCKCMNISNTCSEMHYVDCKQHYIHVEHVESKTEKLRNTIATTGIANTCTGCTMGCCGCGEHEVEKTATPRRMQMKEDGTVVPCSFHDQELKTKPVEEHIKNDAKHQCNVCGGIMVYIRGRHPGHDNRLVCPTCAVESLEQIIPPSEYGRHYGKQSAA